MGTVSVWWGVVLRLDYLNSLYLCLSYYLVRVWLSRVLVSTLFWFFPIACGSFGLRSVDRP